MHPGQLPVDRGSGRAGAAFGDPDQQQREPAEQDVGADPCLEPVVHRAQREDRLHVPEGALGLQQVLVLQGDLVGGQVRVRGGEQVVTVQAFLRHDLGPVDHEAHGSGLLDPLAEGLVVAQRALGLDVRRRV